MTLSRRSAIKAIGIIGAGSALTGTALAVSEHEDDERDPEETPAEEEMGAVRVAHFSPDAPNVDVLVDGEQILSDVGYDEISPYLEVAPGTYTVTITAAGDPDAVVYEESITLEAEYYTAAAIGELEGDADAPSDGETDDDVDEHDDNDYGEDDELEDDLEDDESEDDLEDDEPEDEEEELDTGTFDVLLLVDAGEEDVQEGSSLIRVVHASPDAPAVDILDQETGEPILENVAFTEPSGYLPVDPGVRTVDIFPADEAEMETDPDAEADDELDEDNEYEDDEEDELDEDDEPVVSVELDLEENTAYTAFAIGYLEELDDDESIEAENEDDELEDDYDEEEDELEDDELEDDGLEDDGLEDGEEDELEEEDDRPFDVRVAIDGMTGEEEPEEEEPEPEEEEPEPEEEEEEEDEVENEPAAADD